MEHDDKELAGLVAWKHWRWMPGMLTTNMMRVLESTQECIIGYGDGFRIAIK